ncbi:thioredoxin domain-containing protein, partial [Escherichia coli]|nr:thioredoxin domain-containing protein [Escherichia coli]
ATPVPTVQAPAGKAWVDMISKTKDGGYLQGNPNAPIKLVEYGSRNCPYCGLFGRTAPEPLRKNYISTGKVSWEFRDFLIHGAPDL